MPDLNEDLRAYGSALVEQVEGAPAASLQQGRRSPRARRATLAALGAGALALVAVAVIVLANRDDPGVVAGPAAGSTTPAATSTDLTASTEAGCEPPKVTPGSGQFVVVTYLHCGPIGSRTPLVAVTRPADQSGTALSAALETFMAGATREEASAGLTSGVPDAALGAPATVVLDHDGVATVEIDFDFSTINNFSTSAVTGSFVEPLWATLLQFDAVTAVDLGGFCSATDLDCGPLPRADLERQLEN